jgi:hypothetical protein
LYSVDVAAFLSLAKVGDRLEFQREGYCHWAIYVGEQYIPIDDKVFVAPLLEKRRLYTVVRSNFTMCFGILYAVQVCASYALVTFQHHHLKTQL